MIIDSRHRTAEIAHFHSSHHDLLAILPFSHGLLPLYGLIQTTSHVTTTFSFFRSLRVSSVAVRHLDLMLAVARLEGSHLVPPIQPYPHVACQLLERGDQAGRAQEWSTRNL
jgi:hypothetical protein